MSGMSVVERAIEGGGGLGLFASKCGVKYQAVQKWRRSGRIPAERVLCVEEVSGVPRHELRPDLYPPADSLFTTRRKRA
jgi:DNA-binding transcriptional regulator YdaS (Cro superfamily)